MNLISGANTNVTSQIQVHVHLTGKCLLKYIEVIFHNMETDLHTFFARANVNVSLFLPYITCHPLQLMYWWLVLTHWGQDKMAAIFQTTFWNALTRMKIYKFHWSLFPRVQLTIFQHLDQIMAWRRPGDKPLSQPMMVSLLMPYMRRSASMS